MTILADILTEKRKEVEQLKQHYLPQERHAPLHSFYRYCQQAEQIQIIAEFKRASPSKGVINAKLDPRAQAIAYQKAGAAMISVLTDQPFFQGSFQDLREVRSVVDLPILNKDFIIDEIQIDRAYQQGADVILLIAAALPEQRLEQLYHYATKLGLEVLLEVHDPSELALAKQIGASLIGVNNRNLKTFEVDLAVTEALAKLIDHSKQILISESGIKNSTDVARVRRAGAKAILVGETMMRSTKLEDTFTKLTEAGASHAD
ncbi:indole-3-glycerol phosphate synthase TrpC [Amphibacillus sediminis]|uniref:indole-3-glycerol phosphate synthase TrpC n=1 Tax=Amphibacillus sediminis TaxID=360185 RepID=UPI000834856F|nr:indole-3-glycerol phosphate synthase TrpC [Amphibacillus sediminis]